MPGGLKGVWRQFITNNWNVDPALVKQGSTLVPVYRAWDRLTDGVYRRKGFAGQFGTRSRDIAPIPITVVLNWTAGLSR